MSAGSDDDDGDVPEDAQLKQLRVVWVAMRDEQPSDRGLAALMAAARDQAATMKPAPSESWGQRTLAMLRRPPVLALASVMILLGGAFVVMHRHDEMKVDATSSVARDEPQAASGPRERAAIEQPATGNGSSVGWSAGSGSASGPGGGSSGEASAGAPGGTLDHVAPAPEVEPTAARPPKSVVVAPPKPRPPMQKAPMQKPKLAAPVTASGGDVDENVAGAPAKIERPEAGLASAQDEAQPVAPTNATRSPKPRPSPSPAPESVEADDGAAVKKPAAKKEDDRSRDQVSQLVKQCESAAARSDCAAVRVLAKRIQSSDETTYKTHVLKNTSIARCLE